MLCNYHYSERAGGAAVLYPDLMQSFITSLLWSAEVMSTVWPQKYFKMLNHQRLLNFTVCFWMHMCTTYHNFWSSSVIQYYS